MVSTTIPCKNCITYILCKNAVKEYIISSHEKFITVTAYKAYANVLDPKCHLIREYWSTKIENDKPPNIKNLLLEAFDMTETDVSDLIHTSVCRRRDNERTNSMY